MGVLPTNGFGILHFAVARKMKHTSHLFVMIIRMDVRMGTSLTNRFVNVRKRKKRAAVGKFSNALKISLRNVTAEETMILFLSKTRMRAPLASSGHAKIVTVSLMHRRIPQMDHLKSAKGFQVVPTA